MFYPNSFGTGDNVFLWWQPFDYFRFQAGKFVNESINGMVGNHWCHFFTVRQYDPNTVFSAFSTMGINVSPDGGNLGVLASAHFDSLNVPLSVYVFLPQLRSFRSGGFTGHNNNIDGFGTPGDGVYQIINWNHFNGNDPNNGVQTADRVFQRLHYALSYRLENIGLVRAQFIGANPAIRNPGEWNQQIIAPRVEAAFNLTAVNGLNLDIGGKYFLPLDETMIKTWKRYNFYDPDESLKWTNTGFVNGYLVRKGIYRAPVFISARASFDMNSALSIPFVINASLDYNFGAGTDFDESLSAVGQVIKLEQGWVFNAHLWGVYNLDFMRIGFDLGFMMTGDNVLTLQGVTDPQIRAGGLRVGGGAYVQKNIGLSVIRAGVFYSAPTVAAKDFNGKEIVSDGVLTIPITFEFSF